MKWIIVRSIVQSLVVIILTTLTINAFDERNNFADSLLGSVISSINKDKCPSNMVAIETGDKTYCIDVFEASPSSNCFYQNPENQDETRLNLARDGCIPESKPNTDPWRNISLQQAEQACVKAGKRLPLNNEWYRASLGTPDLKANSGFSCHIGNIGIAKPFKTGSKELCKSSAGVFDMVGNVWEWVDETIIDRNFQDRKLPEEGYVTETDTAGVVSRTKQGSDDLNYGSDFFWTEDSGLRGMLRGGYWGNSDDAGIYAINSDVPPSFSGTGVGFRCVK